MKVTFTRWCMDPKSRTPVSVEPKRVDVIEHYGDAYGTKGAVNVRTWWWEDVLVAPVHDQIPACTKIVMQGKQEYLVQGTVDEVTAAINEASK